MSEAIQKIENLLDECKKHINTDPALSREKAVEALKLSEACKYQAGRYECLFTIGRISNAYNQCSEAINYFEQCNKVAEKMDDLKRKALAINACGVTYDNMLIHSKSLECFLEALDIVKKNQYYDLECKILNNISTVFSDLNDYQTALTYLFQAHQKAQDKNEPVAVYLRNIANIYLDTRDYQKCYDYSLLARNAVWREKDEEQHGDIYLFLALCFAERGKLKKAYRYFNLGFELTERNHCFFSHAEGCYDLAKIFFAQKEFDSAISYLNKSLEICNRFEFHEQLRDIYKLFADIYHLQEDLINEINSLRKYTEVSISLEERESEKKKAYAQMQLTLFNIRKEREYLRDQVYRDPLTGTLSYRDFEESVRKALMVDDKAAMIFLDVDNLKTINDKYGHDAGDKLIIEFAESIMFVLKGRGLVFRKGGDEFIALLPFSIIDELNIFIEEMFAYLSKARVIGKTVMPISCSMGIAIAPKDSSDPKELEKMADKAMYQAKKMGKRCYCFYENLKIE